MPKRYRLIVYTIEALQITPESVERAAVWCGGAVTTVFDPIDKTKRFAALNLPTMDGIKRAEEGDYVVKGPDGRFDIVKKAIFENKYELAQ